MSVTKITDSNIESIDASKLTGALPANMSDITKSAVDPAIDTNPVGGVGTVFLNTTSGEMFSLTDATTDQNTWTNTGSGAGDVVYIPPVYQGTQYGYSVAGTANTSAVERFSFTTDGNSTYVGDIVTARAALTGNSSYTHGYDSGSSSISTVIDKFSFYGNHTASLVGSLNLPKGYAAGQSSSTNGYASGGQSATPLSMLTIDKISFFTDGDSTNIGNLTVNRGHGGGCSSTTHGYTSCGLEIFPAGGNTATSYIDKFSFSSDGSATTVGNASRIKTDNPSCSSSSHGYNVSGYNQYSALGGTSGPTNEIDKYSFSSDGNATIVGTLSYIRYGGAGCSSVVYGYLAGGYANGTYYSTITKFNFSSESSIVDIGDLTATMFFNEGHQV